MIQEFRRTLTVTCGLLALAGCASTPEDTSPKNPTSVVRVNYSISGGFVPDFHGDQLVYTRGDRRRIDMTMNYDNLMMRWANSDLSDIFRMDQNLAWLLNNGKRIYRECPLAGCNTAWLLAEASDDGDDEAYVSYADRGCSVSLANNDYEVTKTGNRRQIRGLDASEYVVRWQTDMQDEQGRTDTNLLQFVFWTAVPTEEMSRAWRVHTEATDHYLRVTGDDNVFVRLLGREGYKAVAAFTGDIEQTDKSAYQGWMGELARIEGYPLSIDMEWYQRSEACPEVKMARSTDVDLRDGLDGLKNAASGMLDNFVSDKKEALIAHWQKAPRVKYLYEITSITEELVHDSVFERPTTYRLADRQ